MAAISESCGGLQNAGGGCGAPGCEGLSRRVCISKRLPFQAPPNPPKNKTRLSQDTSSSHSNQPELSQPPFIPIRLVLLVSFVCLNLRVVANQNLSPLRNLRSLHGGPCSQRLLQQIRPPLLSGLVKLACYSPTRHYPRSHLRHQHLPAYRRSTDSLAA